MKIPLTSRSINYWNKAQDVYVVNFEEFHSNYRFVFFRNRRLVMTKSPVYYEGASICG